MHSKTELYRLSIRVFELLAEHDLPIAFSWRQMTWNGLARVIKSMIVHVWPVHAKEADRATRGPKLGRLLDELSLMKVRVAAGQRAARDPQWHNPIARYVQALPRWRVTKLLQEINATALKVAGIPVTTIPKDEIEQRERLHFILTSRRIEILEAEPKTSAASPAHGR